MLRQLFSWLMIGLLSLLPVGCSFVDKGGSKETTVPVKIGYQVIPNTEAIVKANHWHEETMKGAAIQWVPFDSGRDVNHALASNSIDIGLLGSTLVATGISKGLDYQVIWLADVIGANEALVVKKDRGINDMLDLKGKTIAVTFGSTTQYTLLGALKTNHIDPKEVKIVDMKPAEMLAAWKRGDIDGGYVWHPTLQNMVDDGGKILIHSGDLIDEGIVTADVIVVRREFAKAHPDIVAAYLESQIRAVEFYRGSPDQAVTAVAKEFSLEKVETDQMMKELVWLSGVEQQDQFIGTPGKPGAFSNVLLDTAQFLHHQGLIDKVPDADVFNRAVAPDHLEKALQQPGN